MIITKEQILKAIPDCKLADQWAKSLSDNIPSTWNKDQVSAFLAQCAHESSSFNLTEENLNYSEQGLLKIFGKYFGPGKADPRTYARNPAMIANLVYANRMGNGSEQSGDGFRFRGRGLIQLTGRSNYQMFADSVNDQLIMGVPEVVSQPEYALKSALWFWSKNNLAQETDFIKLTKKINGGIIGLDHRQELYKKFLSIL